MRAWPVAVVFVAAALAPHTLARQASGSLSSPGSLGILESPDREEWQQPERIMDALTIADGSEVADIGAGGGWFTIRLATRVGPNGRVYAEDIEPQMIESIRRRAADHELTNVQTVLGTPDDPHLPESGLHAVLIVDTFPEFSDPVAMLGHVAAALAPGGLLGVVDFKKDGAGGPGPPLDQRVDPDVIRRNAGAAGLKFRREETFLRYQYFLIFGK